MTGQLPRGWKKQELGNLVAIQSGTSPSNYEFDESGSLPYIKVEDLNNCTKFQSKGRQYTNDRILVVPAGAVLFPKRGAAISTNKVRLSSTELCLDSNMMSLIPQEGISSEYLYYLIQHLKLYKIADTSSIPQINNKHIEPLLVQLPLEEEQKRIAQILATGDNIEIILGQFLEQKREQKKALAQRLLTGKKRFPEFKNLEWKKFKANKLFKSSSQKKNGDAPLLAVMQDVGVVPRDMLDRKVAMPEGSTEGYKLIEPGNFVISLRSFQGGLEYSRYRGLVSPAYTVLQSTKEIYDDFYRHYFKSYDFIEHLAVAVIGIRDGKQISYEDFSFLDLPYPSLKEQKKIASALNAADHEVEILTKKLDALKEQKKGLMQQLLTGKKRLKIDKKEAA